MVREFKLPDVGEGVAEGELLAWRVEVGDRVEEDQVVAEVETDKAVVDVPSPVNGTVRELLAEPGEVVPVGDVIVTFDVDGDAGTTTADESTETAASDASDAGSDTAADSGGDEAPVASGRVFAAPSTRRLARELGVDLAAVDGSGPGGRVTEGDVRAAAERSEADDGSGEDDGGKQLKSAVTRIGGDGDSNEGDSDGGKQLKSAVTRIGGDDAGDGGGTSGADAGSAGDGDEDGLTSVVSKVGDDSDAGVTAEGADEAAGRERTLAAPATRRVADDLGVDIDEVPTDETRDGQPYVDEAAVRAYAESQRAAGTADGALSSAAAAAATDSAVEAVEGDRREPYRGVRRTIGEAMERSKFTAPHVTHHETVDATALVETKETLESRAEREGVRLTYLPIVMQAVVAALDEHPILNTQLDEDSEEIVFKEARNIGVATATDAGLMVPVVDDVDEKGLLEIAAETNDLVGRARDRSIDRAEMQGGTFTVTNFGAIGGEYATPIVNHPETAILGLGAIEHRPVAVERESAADGASDSTASHEVVARETLPLSLSVDHRVVDGADAARFVETLGEYLQDPRLLLL